MFLAKRLGRIKGVRGGRPVCLVSGSVTPPIRCGSEPAREGITGVCQKDRVACFASRLAPTKKGVVSNLVIVFAVARGMYEQRECPHSSWACMADMYLGGLLFLQQVNSCLYSVHIHSMRHGFLLQRTYPFDAPRLSTGFALTARHFFQTPKKYPKRLAPAYGLRCAQVSLAQVRSVGTP